MPPPSMPLLLHSVRENRWFKEDAAPWLERGDVPADAVSDLRTTGNELSVWELESDRSNLKRIVCALALGRSEITASGYVVFDSAPLAGIDIGISAEKPGGTPDKGANKWHRDLTNLSGNKLVALTRAILQHGDTGTVLKKEIQEQIQLGIREKHLPDKFKDRA